MSHLFLLLSYPTPERHESETISAGEHRQLTTCVARSQVQRRATRAAVEDRKALLGSANPLQRAQQLKTQADLANSATDTTASLQRTRQLMVEVTHLPCHLPPIMPHIVEHCSIRLLAARCQIISKLNEDLSELELWRVQ